jgi:hypothetical protein
MKPYRIQRKRTKGWRMPENTVYVGRPTKWGNPYKVPTKNGAPTYTIDIPAYIADEILPMYEDWVLRSGLADELTQLRGKNLACFCPLNSACHADVLLRLANQEEPTP